ncbi:uncharacterized protein LOC143522224 [Brachyhypopomus gauderio]|uniref:uncharacterized protein LOC143522224 n=1 Tax=Brachyhypopomus gauderio TaxID=698409 RepID=UPI00404161D3
MESEVEVTLEVGTIGNFKWTDANTADLIIWRVSNSNLFTGKRNTAMRAFEQFVKEKELEGKVTPAWVKKKWENLRQKYKDIKNLSVVGGETCTAPWKWYAVMDQALSGEISCMPSISSIPSVLSPSPHASAAFTSPVLVSSSAQDAPPAKKKKEQYWQAALQELEKQQEERERRALERESERERQALERESRRERDLLARQERWEKELLLREERREREYREREERRDKEAAAREDRLFKLLETFVAKQ